MYTNLSICIIAKNEERNLRRCLQGIVPLQSEIIFVDTGSTDDTLRIASEFTDNLYTMKWQDDFSLARNFAAEKAGNDWILAVDCDEFLTEADLDLAREVMTRHPDLVGMITRLSPRTHQGESQTLHEKIGRLYNRTLFHWKGKIHENIAPINPKDKLGYFEQPFVFFHGGYADEEVKHAKAERDLQMLQDSLRENGPDPYLYFQIGQCYMVLGDIALAANYYDKGLSMNVDPRLQYVKDMVDAYGYALLDLKQYEKALGLTAVYDEFCDRADFLFLMGLIYMNNGRFDDAVAEFEKAAAAPLFSVEGVNSYRARYNIGVIYEITGRAGKAAEAYRSCGDYQPALDRLGKLATVSR